MDIRPTRPYVRVPFVTGFLRPETREAVLAQDPLAEFVPLRQDHPTDYARFLLDDWGSLKTTIIIEHDVIPPPSALTRLLYCSSGWCTHPMTCGGEVLDDTLGLVKFGEHLKRLMPHLMVRALLKGEGSHDWPSWRHCDGRIRKYMRSIDYAPCVHQPRAVHLHYDDAPSMGGGGATGIAAAPSSAGAPT